MVDEITIIENDLDYETHLNMVRELQKIVNAK